MTYLEQYDSLSDDQAKIQLINRWIRTDWRPFFKELREQRPIFVTPGFTLVARFADVTEVLASPRIFSVRLYAPHLDPVADGPLMLSRDETAVNWREKSIMQAVLRPEDLPGVRQMAGRFTDESLYELSPDGHLEVVSQLGRYVPIRMCGDYFGFPGPDLKTMYRWSMAIQSGLFKNLQNDPAVHEASVQAGQEMLKYLGDLLEDKRAEIRNAGSNPPQDTFSRLIRTRFPPELNFDDSRILANVASLLISVCETTSQAIVQAIEQILARPQIKQEAIAAAREPNPDRFDRYVWESLRFNPINPLLFRYCESDYTLAAGSARQAIIPAGTMVFALTASAMFDEDVVPDPDSFILDRPGWPGFTGLHFGYGHHTCLGRHIAGVMIPEVIRRVLLLPSVRLLPPPDGSIDFQGGPFPERFVIGFGSQLQGRHERR
jgi:cytochrome P450